MKLWEAMKLLDEDPSLEFECTEERRKWLLYTVVCYEDLVYYQLDCWDNNGELMTGTAFGSLHGNLTTSDNWELIKQPVTWQEAIQAWADGKEVSYSYMDSDLRYGFEDSNAMMRPEKIKNAKWYVED